MSTVGIVVPAYNGFVVSPATWRVLRKAPYFTIVREGASLGEARNIGISRLNTDYIVPLDGDDYLAEGILDLWQKTLDEHPDVDVVYANGQSDRNGVLAPYYASEWTREAIAKSNVASSCLMFRKSAWLKAGGYTDIVAYEDWEFIARLWQAGCKAIKLDAFGLVHVSHDNNKCTRDDIKYGPPLIRSWLAKKMPEVFLCE